MADFLPEPLYLGLGYSTALAVPSSVVHGLMPLACSLVALAEHFMAAPGVDKHDWVKRALLELLARTNPLWLPAAMDSTQRDFLIDVCLEAAWSSQAENAGKVKAAVAALTRPA